MALELRQYQLKVAWRRGKYGCRMRIQWTVAPDGVCKVCNEKVSGSRIALVTLNSASDRMGYMPRNSRLFLEIQRLLQMRFMHGAIVCQKEACSATFTGLLAQAGLPEPIGQVG